MPKEININRGEINKPTNNIYTDVLYDVVVELDKIASTDGVNSLEEDSQMSEEQPNPLANIQPDEAIENPEL